MIDDIDIITRMNAVCNDVGVDTMGMGSAIAVAMEAELFPWGDGVKALEMVLKEEKKFNQAAGI